MGREPWHYSKLLEKGRTSRCGGRVNSRPISVRQEGIEEGGESSFWRRVVEQYPSLAEVSFSQFATLDIDVTTENQMMENDAEREALEPVQPVAHVLSRGRVNLWWWYISDWTYTPDSCESYQSCQASKRFYYYAGQFGQMRKRISFLSFSDGGCLFDNANLKTEANQTWQAFQLRNKWLLKKKNSEHPSRFTPAFSVTYIAGIFRHHSTFIFRHHLSTCCLKSANHNRCMPMFVSCHFYANEPQVQKVMSVGCDWWISIRLVC